MNIQFSDLIENSPNAPGVYKMYDADGTLLYVGKAKNLSNRLKQYLDISKLEPHKQVMRTMVARVDWETTPTESDALILEQHLIKTQKPRYNIMLTDGKMYPMIALTQSEYPRLLKFRGKITQRRDVYGPYPSVAALNETIKTIQKVCRLRTCTDTFMRNRSRPCLLYQIGRCSAPCTIPQTDYGENVALARRILTGDSEPIIADLTRQMQKFSDAMDYESAATIRDKIAALTQTSNRGIRQNRAHSANFDWTGAVNDLENLTGIKLNCVGVFDNSHLFGKSPVGAMITFGPNGFIKTGYRHFKLRDAARAHKTAPDIPTFGVTKGVVRDGDEHFILPDGTICRDIPKDSRLFLLLRAVRDEAHRFVITFHRTVRAKQMTSSVLDEIDGIGPTRKRALLNHFGSVRAIADANLDALKRVPGLGNSAAEKIYAHFHTEVI